MDQQAQERAGADAGPVDWVVRARELAPMISAASDRIERDRQLPADIMAAMHGAGLYRMCLPRSLGGGAVAALTVMEVLEIVAGADASAAWCLGQAQGCSTAAAFLDPAVARDVFGAPDAVLAWGPTSSTARAQAVDGGYRVSGKFRYASGSRNASWLGAHCAAFEADGSRRIGANGKPADRTVLFPISSAEMSDTWDVIGLRGTGSDDYALDDLFVPDSHSYVRDTAEFRRDPAPLYLIPIITFYGIAFAGVALGIARAALDEFISLAAGKVAARTTGVLRENAVVQSQVAQAEARIGTSRAYLLEMVGETWETAVSGDEFPLQQRARLRLAISHAINQAREVVEYAYLAAGTNAIFANGPFERRFRDMHAVSQQSQGSRSNFESVGQALLGLEPQGGRI